MYSIGWWIADLQIHFFSQFNSTGQEKMADFEEISIDLSIKTFIKSINKWRIRIISLSTSTAKLIQLIWNWFNRSWEKRFMLTNILSIDLLIKKLIKSTDKRQIWIIESENLAVFFL